MSIDHLKKLNADRWEIMKINPDHDRIFSKVAGRLCESGAKERYQSVSDKTGVPVHIIAVIHEREASQSWAANLAQGDPWNTVSIHVPRHQGPFKSWEDAAVNALKRSPPFASQWSDWSTGGALTLLEEYNGLGYFKRGVPSPYLWAGTSIYHRGKYIADGHFDPNAVDHQLGCAGLLQKMMQIDGSVKL